MKPDLNQDLHTHTFFFSNGQDLNEGGGDTAVQCVTH